jgi:predicted DNA-binding protein
VKKVSKQSDHLHIRVSPKITAKLKKLSDRYDRTVSEVVRMLVEAA